MIILKIIEKILAIPLLVVTSLAWLLVKTLISIYGLCYGILGIGLVIAMILFLAYQEWANVIALVIIAVVAFTVMFAGTFIQVLLEEANSALRKIIKN